MKRLRYLPLLAMAALVTVAAVLPSLTLADLRMALPWFSALINRVEALHPSLDGTHMLMFLFVGAAMVLALPRRPWLPRAGWAMAGVLVAALASELVQFWVPGRTPLVSDVRDDLLGGSVGVLLGAFLAGAWGRWRTPRA